MLNFDVVMPNAVLIGEFENGSPEWHELRSQGVGGSDVGAILGLNPWESPYSLWARKSGLLPDKDSSLAMRAGNFFEKSIKEFWLSENPGWDLVEVGTFASKDHPWCHANPDGLLVDPNGEVVLLEIKTSRYPMPELPKHYEAQVMWYLHVLGLKRGKLVAWVSGSEFQEFDIVYDSFDAEAMFARVKHWWGLFESGEAPDWDGATATYEAVRWVNPEIDKDGVVDLGELGVALVNAQSDVDAASSLLNELKSRTMDFMGSAKTAVVDDRVVAVRSARNGGAPFLTVKK